MSLDVRIDPFETTRVSSHLSSVVTPLEPPSRRLAGSNHAVVVGASVQTVLPLLLRDALPRALRERCRPWLPARVAELWAVLETGEGGGRGGARAGRGAGEQDDAAEAAQGEEDGAIVVPTLALGGAHDRCVHPAFFAATLSEREFRGGLTVEAVPAAGHFLHWEATDDVDRRVAAFVERHAACSTAK